jgi:hypothetical protein
LRSRCQNAYSSRMTTMRSGPRPGEPADHALGRTNTAGSRPSCTSSLTATTYHWPSRSAPASPGQGLRRTNDPPLVGRHALREARDPLPRLPADQHDPLAGPPPRTSPVTQILARQVRAWLAGQLKSHSRNDLRLGGGVGRWRRGLSTGGSDLGLRGPARSTSVSSGRGRRLAATEQGLSELGSRLGTHRLVAAGCQ